MAKTSPEKRRKVLYHLRNGKTIRSVAQIAGLSNSTAQRISKSALVAALKSKGGRPKKLQPRHLRFLDHYFELNCTASVKEGCRAFKETFDINVCPTTVRKALQFCKFKARKMVKRPFLRKKHIHDRLKFAYKYRDR